jgi:S-adenosylmethionine/arginine decarboxylase-like enzyme
MKAQIYNYSTWIDEVNPDILFNMFNELLIESGFGVLKVIEEYFVPYGYTALFLLSESHLAIHTFPEHKQTYIELSSCVKQPFDNFIKKL